MGVKLHHCAFSNICLKYLFNICRFEMFPEVSLKTV